MSQSLVVSILFFSLVVLSAVSSQRLQALPLNDPSDTEVHNLETTGERDSRMSWWREARFGMFIHWGLYAVPAGEYEGQRSQRIGEWIMECAYLLASPQTKLEFKQGSEGITIAVPVKPSDPLATVVVLQQ